MTKKKTTPEKERTKITIKSTNEGQGLQKARKENTLEKISGPLSINGQYVKDLSFENPNPIKNLTPNKDQPEIIVNVDVQATPVAEKSFEVVLSVLAETRRQKERIFLIELSYAGVFTLNNTDKEHVRPLLLIECPRLLFPFARSIIAEITREGGYPPLSLAPIDFADLYHKQAQSTQ
jgi:preprotein translocase subunit SecB